MQCWLALHRHLCCFQAKEAARHPWFREYPYPKKVSEMPPCPTVEPLGLSVAGGVGGGLRRSVPVAVAGASKSGSVAVIGKIGKPSHGAGGI